MLKPDATRRNLTGPINAMIEKAGLRIVAQKQVRMTREQAEEFYAVHKGRPFFNDLIATITSGPVTIQVLEGKSAIARYRELLGATDPAKAAPGTIRREFGLSARENAAHGSDGPQTAATEIGQWFPGEEAVGAGTHSGTAAQNSRATIAGMAF